MFTTETDLHSNSTGSSLRDLEASDKHCVFRCGGSWFSLPATSVREITIAPPLVRVPDCHQALAGLCHLRSEFVPAIDLHSLLKVDHTEQSQTHDRLLVMQGSSVWSLLIAEVAALESLETIVTPELRSEDANLSAVMGTAMYGDKIVRVLHPTSLFRLTAQALEGDWNRRQNAIDSSGGQAEISPHNS